MQGRAIPLLVLLSGVTLSLCLCLGCTSEQWVKEYVKGETTGLQEVLNRHTADTVERQKELEKKQIALEEKLTETRVSLEAMDEKLAEWKNSIGRLEEVERSKEGVLNLKLELEQRLARLGEMERDLDHLKEVRQQGYLDKDKDLSALTARIDDLKRYLDIQTDSALRGREALKNFVIEEARALRVEHQEYVRELESIRSRLQAIEGAMGKKGTSDNERRQ